MQFSFPKGEFNEHAFQRLLGAIKDAVEKYDFDPGWTATPATKVIEHNLGVIPKSVRVYASNDPDGLNYDSDSFTAVNSSTITITGPKAYCRVLINK